MTTPPDFDHAAFLRKRRIVFLILVAAYMTVFFHRMAPAVVAEDLARTFHTTGVALGSLAAAYYYIYTAMQIPSGVLADTLGPRLTVTIGSFLAGCGSILFALAPSFEVAITGRLLVGLGVSVVFVALMKNNAVWFAEREYGRVSGLTLLLGNVGSILAAGPLALLLASVSWRGAFLAAGTLSLIIAVFNWLYVRNRPEEAGFPSIQTQEGLPSHVARRSHWLVDLKDVVTNRHIWPGFWVNFGMTGTFFAFAGLWGVPLMRDLHGLERADSSLYTTVALIGFAIGSFNSGWLSDRIGRRKPVILGGALLTCLLWLGLIMLPWEPGWSGLMLYGLLGLVNGGFVVTYAAAKELLPPGVSGMGIALVNTGLFLGAAIMQPAFGWILDITWDGTFYEGTRIYSSGDYHNGLSLSFAMAVLALFAATRIRETWCRHV